MDAARGACACACVVGVYVRALYVAKGDRDAPEVIIRRCASTSVSACVAFAVACVATAAADGARGTWMMTLRSELGLAPADGHARACAVGLGTAACALAGEWTAGTRRRRRMVELRSGWNYWTAMRDFVHAPVVEEFVFRACAWATMRGSGASARATGAWSTALFAAAHAHHYFGMRARGVSAKAAFRATAAQLTFTAAFGAMAMGLFARTRSLAGVVAMHAACNVIGAPALLGDRGASFRARATHVCVNLSGVALAVAILVAA